ncbi:hypothetical protein [uncultured Enterococcus sp.]|uniref:DUF7446 family protein n=1 Tax=uncultured Enterococcus sp. TaxID=167972 RepID=UPI002AA7ECE0|nr:hypothetical protein [uncultured Enterococcus sp.]
MAYEQVRLVCAAVSGDIYLARVNTGGIMSTSSRRVITTEVVRAMIEWMLANGKRQVTLYPGGTEEEHTLYYTDDPEKKKKIEAILNDEL